MRLIGWITAAVTEKDGIVHQDSRVGISAAAVTQEIYQVQSKRRRLDLKIPKFLMQEWNCQEGSFDLESPR